MEFDPNDPNARGRVLGDRVQRRADMARLLSDGQYKEALQVGDELVEPEGL